MSEGYKIAMEKILECIETGSCFLDISCLDLEELPQIPMTVTYLDCSENRIKSIPSLPYLEHLNIKGNNLDKIPYFRSLKTLFCQDNEIKRIGPMPLLIVLYCGNNRLAKIPVLPNLESLHCQTNDITNIPIMKKLTTLNCSQNEISDIPKEIILLKYLNIKFTFVSELPHFPDLISLSASKNYPQYKKCINHTSNLNKLL